MSSRQEEKERRRLEREQAEANATARVRRLQMVGGGVLVAAIVAAIVVAIAGGGGSGSNGKAPSGKPSNAVPIPAQKETDLTKAVKAAGCVLRNFPNFGQEHVDGTVKYKTNPPTSGPHNPVPAQDGIYSPGNEPTKEHFTHTLEHGRIELQYRPGTPARRIGQLETLFNEPFNGTPGYHMLLFENNTNMPFAVAAVAWQHYVGCKTFNDKVFDAFRAFRTAFTDKAPEQIP
jgi:hypothetical protein